jgi:hypothetical protein
VLDDLDLLQEEAETRHDKAESHQGEAGANPCEKRSLGGKIIAEVNPLPHFHGAVHCVAPGKNAGRRSSFVRR